MQLSLTPTTDTVIASTMSGDGDTAAKGLPEDMVFVHCPYCEGLTAKGTKPAQRCS